MATAVEHPVPLNTPSEAPSAGAGVEEQEPAGNGGLEAGGESHDKAEKEEVEAAKFKVGQLPLCFNKNTLFLAKILKSRFKKGKDGRERWEHLVHYQGWNKKSDEWTDEARLYVDDEQSQRLKAKLDLKAADLDSQKAKEQPAGKKRKSGSGGAAVDVASAFQGDDEEEFLKLNIPATLQNHLMKEEQFVKTGRLVPLPRIPSIKDMLTKFIADKVEHPNSAEEQLLGVMSDSLMRYFDATLPMLLLYDEEQAQWAEVREMFDAKLPSEIYGTEHLLRLLCHLPNLLREAKLPHASEDPLRLRIVELMRYIEKNVDTLLLKSY